MERFEPLRFITVPVVPLAGLADERVADAGKVVAGVTVAVTFSEYPFPVLFMQVILKVVVSFMGP